MKTTPDPRQATSAPTSRAATTTAAPDPQQRQATPDPSPAQPRPRAPHLPATPALPSLPTRPRGHRPQQHGPRAGECRSKGPAPNRRAGGESDGPSPPLRRAGARAARPREHSPPRPPPLLTHARPKATLQCMSPAQAANAALAIPLESQAPRRRGRPGQPTPIATVQLIEALIRAGTPRREIAAATGLTESAIAKMAKRRGWIGLAALARGGVSTSIQDQPRAPDAALTAIQHREAARQLRERIAAICQDEALGATKTGSRSKAALELARALAVAIDTERRCLGLDDPKTAGGRSPGVVILLPAQSGPAAWDKTAAAARKTLRRRDAPRTIKASVETVPPAAPDDDDSPDLDAEDDEEGET